MTVGIAVLCNNAKEVAVACDRMITATYPPIEFEHGIPKLDKIGETCVVLTAGDALAHAEICREVQARISVLTRPRVAGITEEIRATYVLQRQKTIIQRFLEPRGWTLQQFYEEHARRLHPDLFLKIDNDIATYDYGLSLIVAGVDPDEAHIYGIRHPGEVDCYDSLGYHSIGIGLMHAVSSLVANGCEPTVSSKMAAYLVYEAKRNAENAPGVGQYTDMAIIREGEIHIITNEEISLLQQIYDTRRIPLTEEFKKTIDSLPF
ncbi:hypothetical protein ES703_20446 [subsurface metagenome]